MPVRRGHIAPRNTYIDTLIKKFDNKYAAFLIANSDIVSNPVIYCSADFCSLFSYSKAQLLLKSATLSFLYGAETTPDSIVNLSNGLFCDKEVKLRFNFYSKENNLKVCDISIAPLKDEFGHVPLHIIFFEQCDPGQLETKHDRFGVCSRDQQRLSSLANIFFHRGNNPHSALKRSSKKAKRTLSVHHNVSPKPDATNRRSSAYLLSGNNHRASNTSLFGRDSMPNFPFAVDTNIKRDTRFGSATVLTGKNLINSAPLSSSNGQSAVSLVSRHSTTGTTVVAAMVVNAGSSEMESPCLPHPRPKSCSNALPLWTDTVSISDSEPGDRIRPASAVLSNRNGRIIVSPVLGRGSGGRLVSAPASQASLLLSGSGPLQIMLSKHAEQPKSHVTDAFAKILSLDEDLHEARKLESPRIHKYTIKHYSPIRAVWDWFILILVIYTVIFTPYMTAFLLNYKGFNCTQPHQRFPGHRSVLSTVDIMVDIMFVFDILINFRTTYVNKNDEVVSNPKKIAMHYLKGWFIIDLVAAIPFDALFFRAEEKQPTALIGLLKSARLLRLISVARKLDRYSEYGTAILLLLTAVFALIAHWLACIWYAIGNAEHQHMEAKIGWLSTLAEQTRQYYNSSPCSGPSLQTKYITALYFTFSSLTSIGFGNVSPNTNSEKVFSIVIMLVGSLMYASIFGNVSAIIQRLYSGTARYHAQMMRIKEFIRFHQIPGPLRQRLEEYFIHAWAYTYGIDMAVVQRSFPECLQTDICMHIYRKMLTMTPAFQGVSEGCLRNVALRIRSLHLPPGDTLIHSGSLLSSLFYVQHGSLEVLDPYDGAILAVLSVGDFFGGLPPLLTSERDISTLPSGDVGGGSSNANEFRRLMRHAMDGGTVGTVWTCDACQQFSPGLLSQAHLGGSQPQQQKLPRQRQSSQNHLEHIPSVNPSGLPVAAKSRFIVRALTYCDLHFLGREEFAAILVLYPELADNFIENFELTMPLAGAGRFVTEADVFCNARKESRVGLDTGDAILNSTSLATHSPPKTVTTEQLNLPQLIVGTGAVGSASSCLGSHFASAATRSTSDLSGVTGSFAPAPTGAAPCLTTNSTALTSLEVERLQRLLEHSGSWLDLSVVPGLGMASPKLSTNFRNFGCEGVGGVSRSRLAESSVPHRTAGNASTRGWSNSFDCSSNRPPVYRHHSSDRSRSLAFCAADQQRSGFGNRLISQFADRFNKIDMSIIELDEKVTASLASIVSSLQSMPLIPKAPATADAATHTEDADIILVN